eukprot:gnl/MRDRNA2_/MRDRNA2_85454_c0_seq1.p1 gnl/MRDRNA2_/MRDRNA2_85454_c0~~gnl/MRDRNA2_/MRDRNA2_85454_c0_seq1.p1  ORF type:complete len:433 (-),score=52.05 gnl/MRDRNA2_/MRDRNA2_85454_c0_seq1:313-1509(-)
MFCFSPNLTIDKLLLCFFFAFIVVGMCEDSKRTALYLNHCSHHKLLSDVIDGVCSINLHTGRVHDASSNLHNLFQIQTFATSSFVDFIQESDRPLFHSWLNTPFDKHADSLLIGFRIASASEVREFEAKIIPLSRLQTYWEVCLQVEGEIRQTCHLPRRAVPEKGPESQSEFPESFYLLSESLGDTLDRRQITHTQKEIQTDLAWISDTGFKCLRCSRPPKPTTLEQEAEASRAMVRRTKRRRRDQATDTCSRQATSSQYNQATQNRDLSDIDNHSSTSQSSQDSFGALEDNSATTPALAAYSVTSSHAKKLLMMDFIERINCTRGGGDRRPACCFLHASLLDARSTIRELGKTHCNPKWLPTSTSQCVRCGLMHDRDNGDCDLCDGSLFTAAIDNPS